MSDSAASTANDGLSSTSSPDAQSEIKTVPEKPNIKYEWYQTDTHVTVALLAKNVKADKVKIEFLPNSFFAVVATDQEEFKRVDINLSHSIVPEQCSFRVLTSKVEIKLSKRYGEKWTTLEQAEEQKPINLLSGSRNWDQVVATELKDDKTESDAALNELFQNIYSQGSDEVKKAMNKSFLESGGTVLSTNWKEVARDTVQIKPPDGMEWKKWDA